MVHSTSSYDFHCHIDLYSSPENVIAECEKRKAFVLAVTTTPLAWKQNKSWMKGSNFLCPALGIHPQLVGERKHEIDIFEQLINETSYIGEVGLDGSDDCKSYWKEQVSVFQRVLEACQNGKDKVISIHSRQAASYVVDMLKTYPNVGTPILHWFSGTKKELQDAINVGCWFSVGPKMAQSKKGKELIALMPKDRVLTETDAPFTGDSLMPWDSIKVQNLIGKIWKVDNKETHEIFVKNSNNVLSFIK